MQGVVNSMLTSQLRVTKGLCKKNKKYIKTDEEYVVFLRLSVTLECKMPQPCLQLETKIGENNFKLSVWSVKLGLSLCRLPAHCNPLEDASTYMFDLGAFFSPRSWS